MKRILTGIKPSGELTLGNYIGAIKQMVAEQNNYETYMFIADMHAITVKQDPKELKERIRKLLALYIACGMDPKGNTIYLQSENEYIASISWILECHTYYGEASRMIQFKEKSKKNENFSVGLLTYPILMAADILYCDADYVPVGIDQVQHVELARDIANRINNQYGNVFKMPEAMIKKEGVKIKDLKDPSKKMSKSEENPQGTIILLDDINVIRKKIMGATTDSEMRVVYDEENKPGISNLINIATSLSEYSKEDIEKMFEGKNYGEFKRFVADIVCEEIGKIQDKYNEIINSSLLDEILDEGLENSRKLAKEKYDLLREKVGLVR